MSEENKYKINVNRQEPSNEELKKFKNFNKVISKHRSITKRPAYKRKRTYFLLLIILLLTYLIFLSEKETLKEEKGLPQTEQTPKIK